MKTTFNCLKKINRFKTNENYDEVVGLKLGKVEQMLAVIRIRGSVGLKKEIKDSFKIMKITRKNHCIVIPENKSTKGMLQKTKDWITWGEISDDVLKKMIIAVKSFSGLSRPLGMRLDLTNTLAISSFA